MIELKVISEPLEVDHELKALGLSEQLLRTMVTRGEAARAATNSNNPPTAGGFYSYAETTRAARELLKPQGWIKKDVRNLAMTVNPETNLRFICSGGCPDTGRVNGTPSSRSKKGYMAYDYVNENRQADLFGGPPKVEELSKEELQQQTWVLLYHTDLGLQEVRAEFSLPVGLDTTGKISGWRRRIILGSIDISDGADFTNQPDFTDDSNIDLVRKKE